MKKMNKFVYALLIGCAIMTGCGNTSTSTETANESISDSQASASITDEEVPTESGLRSEMNTESDNSTITGRIESIEDSTITLSVINMPNGPAPDGNGGGRPDGETPNGDKPEGQAPDGNVGEKPEGDIPSGDKPEGQAPDGNSGGKPEGEAPNGEAPQMPRNDETTSISITDTTVIYDEDGSTITVDSLSSGSMVTVKLDENGNATTITIANPPAHTGSAEGQKDDSAAQTSESDTGSEDASSSNEG